MPIAFSKPPRGIALLESVIAIGVIIAGVVGSLVLVNTSIRLGRANQDKIVAQNLAREGVELAYGLRNSGSLRSVDAPTVSWSSYIFDKPLKANNPDEFLMKYNLGDVVDVAGIPTCKQRCTIDDIYCTTENNDQTTDNHVDLDFSGEDTMQCDVLVLVNYLFNGWPTKPPACDGLSTDAARANYGTQNNGIDNCNYGGDDGLNVVDITTFIDLVFSQSFQFGYAYPSISAAAGTTADSRFNFYSPITGVSSQTGLYTGTNHPQSVWDDPRAQVYTYLGTYVQPNMPLTTDDQPTKFYRVVSLQPICRGTKSGVAAETVIDTSSAFNCKDYVATLSPAWDAGVTNVGALVTSEVRWPTAGSATKVRYQEFLYDWISL